MKDNELSHLYFHIQERLRGKLREMPLSPLEIHLLRLIKDGEISPKSLLENVQVAPNRVSHALNALEKKKLIRRVINKDDRRSLHLEYLPSADDALEITMRMYDEHIGKIKEVLTVEEFEELKRISFKLFNALLLENTEEETC